MRDVLLRTVLAAVLFLSFAPVLGAAGTTEAAVGGLTARNLGPAVMSGRIAALDAVPGPPITIWVGAASGGVWKSIDGGLNFKPVFDDHIQSIGALKVDPQNSETVWVGTGEPWTRNTVSVGDGVYKTNDGGKTWQHMGLADTERISTIRIDPTDSNTIWVCATGHLWNANEERGVFKTTDGGENWEKVLYVDEDTGCADIDIDPQEPGIVYAAMWQYRRWPDFFESGGPGSGLYRTRDGGENWEQIENGLPEGDLGRIAVAVAPSRPSVVYATVEAEEKTSLYRTDDLGESWYHANTSMNISMRPFYFSELVVDPTDHQRVYKPGFSLSFSADGGKTFQGGFGMSFSMGSVHPDHHALWINPENPHTLLLGTDGGLYGSYNRAATWRHIRSLPISQFYHVSHDDNWPYNVMGGLQDNNTWLGPSQKPGGIANKDWELIGMGDGFWAFADQEDSNVLYTEYQGGQLMRIDRELGEMQRIAPSQTEGQEELRFNWNTPIHLSPNDPKVVYYGSQYLHRSRDQGRTWETISPDLTTDDPQLQRQKESGGLTKDVTTAENHCSIYTISESPKNAQLIWVGTDDGNLQITRDGGESWTNVAENVPDLPAGTWVSAVSASVHAEGTAFVTFDGHRRGDMASYVYRTDDFGATWTSLLGDGHPVKGYAWVMKQDPVNPDLLYLGTEMGLYLTLDGGGEWARFEEVPMVAVHDIVIHPEEHDVLLATHGRGIYIIDDITPLRALTAEVLDSNVTILPSRPTRMTITNAFGQFGWNADDEFLAETVPEAAAINYYMKKRHLFGDLKIEILDQDGEVVTKLPASKRRGLNRVYWPMRLKPPEMPAAATLAFVFFGPRVLEGTYTVRLTKGKEVIEAPIELVPDPRSKHTAEDRQAQQELAMKLYDRIADLTYLAETLKSLQDQAGEQKDGLKTKDAESLDALDNGIQDIRKVLVSTRDMGIFGGDEQLRENLANLFGAVAGYDGRPTNTQIAEAERLFGDLAKLEEKANSFLDNELPKVNAMLEKRGKTALDRQSRDAWDADKEGNAASVSTMPMNDRWVKRWLKAGAPFLF